MSRRFSLLYLPARCFVRGRKGMVSLLAGLEPGKSRKCKGPFRIARQLRSAGVAHGVDLRTIRLPTGSLLTARSQIFNRCVENLVEIGWPRQSKSPGMSAFELFAPNDSNLHGSAI